jgi:23S rRNA pseudouridine1911/1915/1917 synthase
MTKTISTIDVSQYSGDPEIIFENEDYLILNKPAGLIVHGGPGIEGKTLCDFLISHYPPIKTVGEDPNRPGIVHRLDKEASGLMVVAKNQKSFNYFKKQFQDRKIVKEYTALAYGQIAKDEETINFAIKRSKDGYRMVSLPNSSQKITDKKKPTNRDYGLMKALTGSKEALTELNVEHRFINYTLLKVKIKTGRTHQIRVHLFAYGHPLVGDNLYFTFKTKIKNQKINLNRIFLVATALSFIDQNKVRQNFNISLPDQLSDFLNKIK